MRVSERAVVIVGGGPAGAVTAHALARQSIDVLLIDARSPEAFQGGESLVPAARVMLQELGLWERFERDGHLPCYGNVSAWGSADAVDTDFIRSPHGHGWHLDRLRFDEMLRVAAAEVGAEVRRSVTLIRCRREGDIWAIGVEGTAGGESVRCRWLIDATGRSGRVVREIGVGRRHEDRQIALYTKFRQRRDVDPDEDSRTLVESARHGWFHTALLPGGDRVVTLFTDAGTLWASEARESAGFRSLIDGTIHLRRLLDNCGYEATDAPRAVDARASRLDRFHGDGWLATGDAATTFDPLSSQGILSALYSGLKAGGCLARRLDGERSALDDYDMLVESVYDRFLEHRRRYHGWERRWPESPYWSARNGARV